MRQRPSTGPLVTFVAGLALAAACGAGAPAGRATAADPAAPGAGGGAIGDFSLKDVDGRTHALSDYLGANVIVLSFWATWCEPCKKEMDQLEQLYAAHKGEGLVVLSVSMDEPESQGDVRPFVKQRGFTFPVLLDTESQVTNQFNPRRAAPYNMIVGRDQQVAWSHEGYVPGDEQKLEAAVLEALGAAPE